MASRAMLAGAAGFWGDLWMSLDRRQREWTNAAPWFVDTGDKRVEATIRRQRLMPELTLWSAAETHPGVVRTLNEDAVLDRGRLGVWAVADGVGGADAGERASEAVVRALAALPPADTATELCEAAEAGLRTVNGQLFAEAARIGSTRGIASTVVCLLIRASEFYCVWAGDSRLYRVRSGRIEQLSRDHSEVQTLIEYGLLTPEEARNHPLSGTITRAVGAAQEVALEHVGGSVEPNDIFLLCSDGLTKVVADDEIALILDQMEPTRAVHRLVRMALERGAPDNVSVVAVLAAASSPADY